MKGPRHAKLAFASKTVEVPRRAYSPQEIDSMATRLGRAQRQLAEVEQSGDEWKIAQAGARVRRFGDLLDQWKQPVDPAPLEVELQALRIGEMVLVAMPGEPFAEIGVAVKKGSPFAVTMFCGYSDGAGGDYMPAADEYQHGGYEVERTLYNPGADEKVIAGALELLEILR